MTAIPRHRLDPQEIRPRLEQTREAMPTFVRGARRDPNHLTLVGSNALDMAAGLSVTEPDSEEIADWVELAAQAVTTGAPGISVPGLSCVEAHKCSVSLPR